MQLVYVFASSKVEAQPVLALAPKRLFRQRGRAVMVDVGENRCAVMITGMGVSNARIMADAALGLVSPDAGRAPLAAQRSLAVEKPDAILAIGSCGGLTQAMTEERIVGYTECLSADNSPPVHCSPALLDAISEILQRYQIACDRVIGITSPRIASTKSQRLALARSGASVVDMESYQILSAAARAGVPATVLRIVSDPLNAYIPDFNSALDSNGTLVSSKAIWVALGSPLATFRLLAANKRAIECLAPAVRLILQSNCFSNSKRPPGSST